MHLRLLWCIWFQLCWFGGGLASLHQRRVVETSLCSNVGRGWPNYASHHNCITDNHRQECLASKGNDDCIVLTLEVALLNLPELIEAISYLETSIDGSIRRVIISSQDKTSNDTNYSNFGHLIDKFLKPRPWFYIIKEPYHWHHQLGHNHHDIIVIDHFPHEYDQYFQHVVSIQYPHSATCDKSTVLIGRQPCIHPGWFSVAMFYDMTKDQFPYAVNAIFVPKIANVKNYQTNAFMTPSDCENETNLWECAFIPMTNCTLPTVITTCNTADCLSATNVGTQYLLDAANTKGKPLLDLSHSGKNPVDDFQQQLHHHHTPALMYASTFNKRKFSEINVGFSTVMYEFNLLLRKNYLYRSRVAQLIHEFRGNSEPYLPVHAPCVAAHIRRGDRLIRGVDISEYCYNATHNLKCRNEQGELSYCNGDFGCNDRIPFAAITLEEIVQRASLLVDTYNRNLIVLSDDHSWLQQQMKDLKEKMMTMKANVSSSTGVWNMYTLPPPSPPPPPQSPSSQSSSSEPYPGYHFMRSQGGTHSGVFFHASLELVRQCEAFVGHFGAGTTAMYYHSMCVRHAGGLLGVCPPVSDLRDNI